MAERRPLVIVSGAVQELPSGDTLPGGTVTSIALTVPTGLSVSGSPITASGTLTISYAAGYSIPSDATQSAWSAKQDALVSGTSIKTINGGSVLGSGDLAVGGNQITVSATAPASPTLNQLWLDIS